MERPGETEEIVERMAAAVCGQETDTEPEEELARLRLLESGFAFLLSAREKNEKEIEACVAETEKLREERMSLGLFDLWGKRELDFKIKELAEKEKACLKKREELSEKLGGFENEKKLRRALEWQESLVAERQAVKEKAAEPLGERGFSEAYADNGLRARFAAVYPALYAKAKEYVWQPGGSVLFGRYPQTAAGNDGTPVEWLILEREKNEALLISRYALDCRKYHEAFSSVAWEDCALRAWLNGAFLNAAFMPEEQELIAETETRADLSRQFFMEQGNDTVDKLFLLSVSEAEDYCFALEEERRCAPTAYAAGLGAETDSRYMQDGVPACTWWLRGSGDAAPAVEPRGVIEEMYYNVDFGGGCVRPAMRVKLY